MKIAGKKKKFKQFWVQKLGLKKILGSKNFTTQDPTFKVWSKLCQ